LYIYLHTVNVYTYVPWYFFAVLTAKEIGIDAIASVVGSKTPISFAEKGTKYILPLGASTPVCIDILNR
jgi:hypothetical protein